MLQHGLLKPVAEFLGPLGSRLFSEKGHPGIQLLFCLNLSPVALRSLALPVVPTQLCKWIWLVDSNWSSPCIAICIVNKPKETPSFAKGGDSALENVRPPSTWQKLEPQRDHLLLRIGSPFVQQYWSKQHLLELLGPYSDPLLQGCLMTAFLALSGQGQVDWSDWIKWDMQLSFQKDQVTWSKSVLWWMSKSTVCSRVNKNLLNMSSLLGTRAALICTFSHTFSDWFASNVMPLPMGMLKFETVW